MQEGRKGPTGSGDVTIPEVSTQAATQTAVSPEAGSPNPLQTGRALQTPGAAAVLTGSRQSPEDTLTSSLSARAALPGSQRTSPRVGCSHEATASASGVTDVCVVWLGFFLIDVNKCATL